MGDRGNICLTYKGGGQLWLHTRWWGSDMPAVVRQALNERVRCDDDESLARIMLDILAVGMDRGRGDAGFRIRTGPGSNEHPYIVVDLVQKRIGFFTAGFGDPQPAAEVLIEKCSESWSFEEYVALTREQVNLDWT